MARRKAKKPRRNEPEKLVDGEVVGVDWSALPNTILEGIFERISLVDCFSVSNVCKAWRSVFSADLPLWNRLCVPSLFMSGQKNKEKRMCIGMVEKRAWEMDLPEAKGKYCWGSFRDWLIMVDEVECYSLDVTLLNPFRKTEIKLPTTWDFFHKLVLSGDPSRVDSVSMLVSGQSPEVQFWVAGAQSWRKFKFNSEPFEDAIFCNGSFFLVTKEADVFQINVGSVIAILRGNNASDTDNEIETRFHKTVTPEDDTVGAIVRYLVESGGEILLVCRYFNVDLILETQCFKIYALDLGDRSWKRVEDLGDRTLFLGKCSSMAFSSNELRPELANSVYFSNDSGSPWWNEWNSTHLRGMSSRFGMSNSGRKIWGIFELGDEGNKNFCFRGHRDIFGPTWFTAPLWWYCGNFFFN